MNKAVLAILFLSIALPATAELKRDPKTCRYYSIPITPDINQEEYHNLYWQCCDIKNQVISSFRSGGQRIVYRPNGSSEITLYLQRIATPTSIRLLNDLKAINFAI